MEEQRPNVISIIIGIISLAIIFTLVYYILVSFYPISEFIFMILGIVFLLSIVLITYFCIRNMVFRAKVFDFLSKLSFGISKLGDQVIKNYFQEGKKSLKKERKQIADEVKNKVYDIAADKCQICGTKGNLKIHHIDGNPSNNRITNLILLCGNHHDDADKGTIPKWRLKDARTKQKTAGHISVSKEK